jgi:hypothetical protein
MRRRSLSPEKRINLKLLELQVAKEILAEVFHAKPKAVEGMIQSRIEERIWATEQAEV